METYWNLWTSQTGGEFAAINPDGTVPEGQDLTQLIIELLQPRRLTIGANELPKLAMEIDSRGRTSRDREWCRLLPRKRLPALLGDASAGRNVHPAKRSDRRGLRG